MVSMLIAPGVPGASTAVLLSVTSPPMRPLPDSVEPFCIVTAPLPVALPVALPTCSVPLATTVGPE
ncbi:hypothetical protein J2W35_004710 [Variovorax boronicumulans]|uniref:hypothetical protein n=1 Tax=Variovorax boronicumulans TaxID=436515 RepID=UPI00278199FB|nr:hypothetical protein [Variovorax boronicumulans]MDQ0084341.1 hypothetical protein [Variovorax boronicumulans]